VIFHEKSVVPNPPFEIWQKIVFSGIKYSEGTGECVVGIYFMCSSFFSNEDEREIFYMLSNHFLSPEMR